MSRTKRWFFIYIPVSIAVLLLFLYTENNSIGTTAYKLSSSKLPSGFERYRIVHLSDLQSKEFGRDQRPLIRKVQKLKPDIIVVTGDLVDSTHYNADASYKMMKGVAEIAPVYFARGNHEYFAPDYPALEQKLREAGIHILQNVSVSLPLGDGRIELAGVDDPVFDQIEDGDVAKISKHLDQALGGLEGEEAEAYTVLLSHRPELFQVYADYEIDLSLAGHAHGGQFRIPFVGGVYSPEQGFWPDLSQGSHTLGDSTLIVSRGLGNSIIPQRLFNRPEIVVVDLIGEG
ncbi:metallophosphoesterase [Paenibacillus sp. GCM10027627]|uniref:metallophosphoesterase n=1 Tax=unclassified Paenibacillus TaxID=185978 RepID=UPI0036386FFE